LFGWKKGMGTMDLKGHGNSFDRLIGTLAFIAGVLLLLITIFVCYAVIMRYAGFKPPVWVLQFTEYALLWITFLGAAWLLKKDGHIRIDTLISRLNPASFRKVGIIDDFLGIIVSAIIFWFGTLHTIDCYQRTIMEVKGVIVPKFAVFLIIPLGGLALAIQFGRDCFNKIRSKSRPGGI
jgi:C4-dicarboxylate transporter DctQ subunit